MFAVTPERVGIAEGVRAALAMAPLLVAATLLARPEIALGAVAAFWNCLCDPQGSKAARLKAMVNFTVMGVVVLTIASWGANWGERWAGSWAGNRGYTGRLAILFALVFLCGLTRSYKAALGPMPAQAGFIASLAVVIGVASARPLTGALELGGYFLLGSVWTMLFCVFLVPIPFRQSGNLTLAAIFGRLESMAAFVNTLESNPQADSWQTFDLVHRRGVRMSIERGRALAALDTCNGLRLGAYIDASGRIFSALIAIGQTRRNASAAASEPSRRLLQALQRLLLAAGNLPLLDGPLPDTLVAQARALLHEAASQDDAIARCVKFAANAVVRLSTPDAVPAAGSGQIPVGPAPAARGIDALVWRHAFRVALAAVVAFAIGTWLNVTLAYWGALAAIIVTQPVAANTWLRILERACGSIVGGLIAAALLATLPGPGPGAMTLAILPLAALAIACRLVSYGFFVVFLCPMFMLISDFIHPTGGLIAARFINEVIGACVGVAASFLLWPGRHDDVLNAALQAAISANMNFASAALRMDSASIPDLDRLQREAGMASTRLETARERLLLEGRWRSAGLERLREVIVSLRVVCGTAAVVEVLRDSQPRTEDRQRADACDATTAQLLHTLATRTPLQIPLRTSKPADDDLGQAVHQLTDALNHYVTLPA